MKEAPQEADDDQEQPSSMVESRPLPGAAGSDTRETPDSVHS